MKLISVQILGNNFRSLPVNKAYKFNNDLSKKRLAPKVFAGLNGSGKSNMLELISEIFFVLELDHQDGLTEVHKRNIGFEIEYHIPIDQEKLSHIFGTKTEGRVRDYYHIKIRKETDSLPEYQIKRPDQETFLRLDEGVRYVLPNRVIAYSSGQNEHLSNPFNKIKYFYFDWKLTRKDAEFKDRLIYLNYTANYSIFLANQLIPKSSKIEYYNKVLEIEGLDSFRITLNLVNYRNNPIELSDTASNSIDLLKKCATSWVERKEGKKHKVILDYLVQEATIDAFTKLFHSSFNLFQSLYELETLNLHLEGVDSRRLVVKNSEKNLNVSADMPKVDPDQLAFRIERVRVNKKLKNGEVGKLYYRSLSDGEHQLNEILGSIMMLDEEGCLFLFDEPDTHFNPKWRAKLVMLLNKMSAKKFDSKGIPLETMKHEMLLTTHSPYVISDSDSKDVYQFEKEGGDILVKNPKSQTYGASIGFLNEEIFGRDNSIADYSNFDLEELKRSIKEPIDIENARERLFDFGESIEKFDALRFLREKENEFKESKE